MLEDQKRFTCSRWQNAEKISKSLLSRASVRSVARKV